VAISVTLNLMHPFNIRLYMGAPALLRQMA